MEESLGKNIREARQAHNLSQSELCYRIRMKGKLGLYQNNLSNIERGIFRPSLETLRAIAQELDLTVDDLLQYGRKKHGR
jgi:transcriptional regulator with XRE-family HTH domain